MTGTRDQPRRPKPPAVGLRGKLATTIGLVAVLAVGASFVAVYTGIGSRLRGQIDSSLRTQAAEWRQFTRGRSLSTPAAATLAAREFLASQRYHAESLVIVAQLTGGATVTNNPEVLAREEARGVANGLLKAPPGLSDRNVAEAGMMRVLTRALTVAGRRVGTMHFADPLRPVADAQSSLLRTFAFVGAVVTAAAILVGIMLAALIALPLRRLTTLAETAADGDLSVRTGPIRGHDEVAILGRSFNEMLARLQRAFARQRQFVHDASHELRTPLAVARAQAELLNHETDPQRLREAGAMLLGRLDALDRLITDMLTLAGAEGGSLIEPLEFELHDFFEDLRRDLPLFGERNYHVQAIEGALLADQGRMTQVLRNLIRNAVSHTDKGDRVEIRAEARGSRLQITVSDSGPGVPSQELERIFERFHRVEQSRSRDRGGTGLGLSIARAIVEAHGGWIRAESSPGRGATFRFELPGYSPPPGAATASVVNGTRERPAKPSAPAPRPLRGRRHG